MAKKELTEKERIEHDNFIKTCRYVEKEIFNYDDTQRLQKKAILRLRGLKRGQNIANNSHEQYGEYPFEVILLAFKMNKDKILYAIRNKTFESEEYKMAYVCAIILGNINDVYTRFMNAQKQKKKIDNVDSSIINHDGAEYVSKTKTDVKTDKSKDKKFKDLW